MPSASIVVPTYNQAQYLPITLDSLWFQQWDELEIIVVNDGSSDATREVLEAYEAGLKTERASFASSFDAAAGTVERTYHPRYPAAGRTFTVLHNEVNRGLSDTLSRGFRAASGELCTFIASDDCLLPDMLSELARALDENDADFAYADMHVVDDAGRILRRFSLPDYSFEACFCQWYLCGVCKLYKRSLHERFGYFDPAYTVQDHEAYLRFAMGGARFVHVPRVLANVRSHDQAAHRQVDNHSPAGMSRLYRESSELVLRARAHLAAQANVKEGE
jgi:glycosyltransferase involved in cell wall biosynthesis